MPRSPRRDTQDREPTELEVEDFSFAVAHDLRQPLLAALLTVKGLGTSEDPRINEGHRLIQLSLEESLGRIRALLSLAGLERRPPLRELVSLSVLARAAVHRAQTVTPDALDIAVVGDRQARTDPGLVAVVLDALLHNALAHATPCGRIARVGVHIPADGSPAVVVSDDGPGVAPELVATVFQPRAGRPEGGNGLGLAIAARAARQLGGTLNYEARTPHGARFRFCLGRNALV